MNWQLKKIVFLKLYFAVVEMKMHIALVKMEIYIRTDSRFGCC